MKKLLTTLVIFSFAFLSLKEAHAYSTNMNASLVIGQTDLTSNTGSVAANKLGTVFRNMIVDPKGRLIVSDRNNSRVLIWNSVPTQNNTSADLVLCQADFTSSLGNRGGSRDSNTCNNPNGVYSDGNRLIVVDEINGRVLIWNTFPTSNGQSADVVLGKISMTDATFNCSRTILTAPIGVGVYGTKLVVSDRSGNRIFIWNSIPTTNNAPADVVMGQSDFTTCTAQTISNKSLSDPRGISVDPNGRVVVADRGRQRILIWNSIPTTNNASADVVVGQPDFTSSGGTVTASTVGSLLNVYSTGQRLFVPTGSNRVLIFNSIPSSNGASADIVLGQANFTDSSSNQGGSTQANTLNSPTTIFEVGDKLLVGDESNARVLIYRNILSGPQLGWGGITSSDNGKLRISGNVQIGERGTYGLHDVSVSVNGSGFQQATHEDSGEANGDTNTIYNFYHDFEPWGNNNGTSDAWRSDNSGMTSSLGYTLNIKATSSNAETDNLFFFSPFTLNSVSSGILPTINFSVNSNQLQKLKDNISAFQVKIKKSGSNDWVTYIDTISVSSAQTSITGKNTLPSGTYDVQIVARDNWGHTVTVSNTKTYKSSGIAFTSNKPSMQISKEWFPLQISKMSGVNSGILASFKSDSTNSYKTSTSTPTFSGVAFSGATVTIQVTDTKTGKSRTYSSKSINSAWTIKPTLYGSSIVDVWVTDGNGRYNELPSINITS